MPCARLGTPAIRQSILGSGLSPYIIETTGYLLQPYVRLHEHCFDHPNRRRFGATDPVCVMRWLILVNTGPPEAPALRSAATFAVAARQRGDRVRVFLHGDAVLAASPVSTPVIATQATATPVAVTQAATTPWTELAQQGIDLYLCSAARERRLPAVMDRTPFHIAGMAEMFSWVEQGGKVVSFGGGSA